MKVVWQVEIDKNCQSVLRHHWPDVPVYDDVTKVKGADLERVDLICGGFPCQDLPVAGRRAGLAGERSGLFFEFMRVADECAPEWLLIENVPGLLSSNRGRDMGTVVGTLGDMGYGWAYRVVDAQWFGVAQRRRRLYLLAHRGVGGAAACAEVLSFGEGSPWDPAPSRQTGKIAAGELARSLGSVGGGDDYGANKGTLVAGALTPWDAESKRIRGAKQVEWQEDIAYSLNNPGARRGMTIRRLMPIECERLQGFPDGWTAVGVDGPQSDGARYRQLGNAVCVNVAEWIGRRIMEAV
jgi:DNA (cytosine-5)-methyltransferase 1